jgi:hypothetical protein
MIPSHGEHHRDRDQVARVLELKVSIEQVVLEASLVTSSGCRRGCRFCHGLLLILATSLNSLHVFGEFLDGSFGRHPDQLILAGRIFLGHVLLRELDRNRALQGFAGIGEDRPSPPGCRLRTSLTLARHERLESFELAMRLASCSFAGGVTA